MSAELSVSTDFAMILFHIRYHDPEYLFFQFLRVNLKVRILDEARLTKSLAITKKEKTQLWEELVVIFWKDLIDQVSDVVRLLLLPLF